MQCPSRNELGPPEALGGGGVRRCDAGAGPAGLVEDHGGLPGAAALLRDRRAGRGGHQAAGGGLPPLSGGGGGAPAGPHPPEAARPLHSLRYSPQCEAALSQVGEGFAVALDQFVLRPRNHRNAEQINQYEDWRYDMI